MKKANVRSFLGNSGKKTAAYVVAHAQAKKNGRRPSESYKHERNPIMALKLAQAELAGRSMFMGTIANSGGYSDAGVYCESTETREHTKPLATGEVVYEKPMILQLIDLFAGKPIYIKHIDSNQKSSQGICKTVHAVPHGQREHFDIELRNGNRYGFVPDTVDAISAEGGMDSVKGRRRFEIINQSVESQLKQFMVGKHVSITHEGSIFLPIDGVCQEVLAVPAGQDLYFEVELSDGHYFSIIPDNFTADYVEGGICKTSGRRKFELVANAITDDDAVKPTPESMDKNSQSFIRKVSDLLDEMRDYHDVGVAMQVQSAIQEAINRKLIGEFDCLTAEV